VVGVNVIIDEMAFLPFNESRWELGLVLSNYSK